MYHTVFSHIYSNLPTGVDGYVWIDVDKSLFAGVRKKAVDKMRNLSSFTHGLSTKVGNILSLGGQGLKKELDRLSTYPQRLLLLLNKS
jgi:hypothetical protein